MPVLRCGTGILACVGFKPIIPVFTSTEGRWLLPASRLQLQRAPAPLHLCGLSPVPCEARYPPAGGCPDCPSETGVSFRVLDQSGRRCSCTTIPFFPSCS